MVFSNGGGSVSAVNNDNGTAAWNITQSGGGIPSDYAYLPANISTDPRGWTATMVVRVDHFAGPYYWGTRSLRVEDGSNRWSVNLVGTDSNTAANGIYYQTSTPSFVQLATTDTHSAYHNYQLIYNPSLRAVDVYLDGSLVKNLQGGVYNSGYLPSIYFGGGSSNENSSANFSDVSFETGQNILNAVPEPSAFLMAVAVVGVGAAARVWVRHRAWPTAGATDQ